jgi:hypothetical protein
MAEQYTEFMKQAAMQRARANYHAGMIEGWCMIGVGLTILVLAAALVPWGEDR